MPYLQELARVYFRDRPGAFVMLECYADDSGTHDDSEIIVWGGVLCHQGFMAGFEQAWNKRLQAPCEGRPPLKKGFHSSHLLNGWGEFEGYSEAERDLTRHNFRQVIIDTGITIISYGISKAAYEKCARGDFRRGLSSPEEIVFGSMILRLCDAADEGDEPISFQFDKGREKYVAPILNPAINESHIDNDLVSHGFSSTLKNVGLQAADLVAHETYRYLKKFNHDKAIKAHPHLEKLIDGAYDAYVFWFGEQEIEDMYRKTEQDIKKMEGNPPSSGSAE